MAQSQHQHLSFVYDPEETFTYRYVNPQDPDGSGRVSPRTWPSDTFVVLRRHRNQEMLDNMAMELASQSIKYDAEAERKHRRSGKKGSYSPGSELVTKKTGVRATLEHGILDWSGSGFSLPRNFKIPGTQTLHADAGQLMEVNSANIGLLHETIVHQINDVLDTLWQNPDADQEEIFRLLGETPPGQPDDGRTESGAAAPVGAV